MRRSLLAALTLAGTAPLLSAQTLYVDSDLTTGANDGSSWADAFRGPDGLQAALGVVQSGERVFVAEGLYRPSASGNRSASFGMLAGVEIYGGFLGTEAEPEERPGIGTAPSVLSGDLAANDPAVADNSFHVVTTANTNSTAVLDGFEIRGGNASGGGGANSDRGAGILAVGGVRPTVRNCRFVANRCSFGGAAGYINTNAAPRFTACIFEDGDGGAFGGAFDIAGGGAVTFDRCLFQNNRAARAGALEVFSTNNVRVRNSVFRGNVSTGSGGGGAIWVGSGGNTRFISCSIVGNSSTNQAVGGLRNQGAPSTTVASCIVWGNTGPGGAQASANQITAGGIVSYSIVEGGYAGTANSGDDPQFVDAAGGDFSVFAGSPAIDAGDANSLAAQFDVDFAGEPRFVDDTQTDDTGLGGPPALDIGAFEFQPTATRIPGCAGNPSTLSSFGPGLAVGGTYGLKLAPSAPGIATGLLYVGLPGFDGSGCGLVLPGIGELLLDPLTVGDPLALLLGPDFSAVLPVPGTPTLAGNTLAFQAATSFATGEIELSNAVVETIAP